MATMSSVKSSRSYVFIGDMLTPVNIDTSDDISARGELASLFSAKNSSLSIDKVEKDEQVQESRPVLRPTGIRVLQL